MFYMPLITMFNVICVGVQLGCSTVPKTEMEIPNPYLEWIGDAVPDIVVNNK